MEQANCWALNGLGNLFQMYLDKLKAADKIPVSVQSVQSSRKGASEAQQQNGLLLKDTTSMHSIL